MTLAESVIMTSKQLAISSGQQIAITDSKRDLGVLSFSCLSTQTQTVETITNPLADHIVPFRCGAGKFDMQLQNVSDFYWLYNGTKYTASRLQLTTLNDEVVWLCFNGAVPSNIRLDNNYTALPIKTDLKDLQGKIAYYLDLRNCSLVTGSLADLQGKVTRYLNLAYCTLVTGSLSDLQGKITYYLSLANCSLVTGSLADLQGNIAYYLDLRNCSLVTGSLADLQGKITYWLNLAYCSLVTGSLADLQGKITYLLSLAYCTLVTGSLSDLQGKITYYLSLANCSLVTGIYSPISTATDLRYVYLSGTGQSTAEVDQTIINIANVVTVANGALETNARTSTSDSAVATLKALGWTVRSGGVLQ